MKLVLKQAGKYAKDAYLAMGLTASEVLLEILLPFVTAIIIDDGLQASNLSVVVKYGLLMVLMSFVSLAFAAAAGRFASKAATGFGANLREAIYNNVQTFSFSNIDKFSVPGLVTRMTTDITNVQWAYMMCTRMAVRAPLNLIFSFIMCLIICPQIAPTFLIAAFSSSSCSAR